MSKRILGEEGDRRKDKRLFQARKDIGERGWCGRCRGTDPRLRSNERSLEETNLLSLWQVRLRMFYWDSKTELWGLLSTMPGQGLLGTGLSEDRPRLCRRLRLGMQPHSQPGKAKQKANILSRRMEDTVKSNLRGYPAGVGGVQGAAMSTGSKTWSPTIATAPCL